MIRTKQIIKVLEGLAKKAVPGLKGVYKELIPVNFERPAAMLEIKSWDVQSASNSLVKIDGEILLTGFIPQNDFSHSNMDKLLEMRDAFLDIFRLGYVQVGDRRISISAQGAIPSWDAAQVVAKISFFDDREKVSDPLPVMEIIDTRMDLKG